MESTENVLKLGKGSKITIAVFSFIFGLMMLPMAFDPPRPELGWVNTMPSAFCFLIVGACILPDKVRGYCGDLIAGTVIGLAIWFFIVWYQDPQPDQNPFKFALVFGGISVVYLAKRYGKFILSKYP
ncbi:MAG: hypothetical protein KUG50_01200 [Cycloclasticus sp.]|nr:hypothetical protein [Cycloclasticus sp.]